MFTTETYREMWKKPGTQEQKEGLQTVLKGVKLKVKEANCLLQEISYLNQPKPLWLRPLLTTKRKKLWKRPHLTLKIANH